MTEQHVFTLAIVAVCIVGVLVAGYLGLLDDEKTYFDSIPQPGEELFEGYVVQTISIDNEGNMMLQLQSTELLNKKIKGEWS